MALLWLTLVKGHKQETSSGDNLAGRIPRWMDGTALASFLVVMKYLEVGETEKGGLTLEAGLGGFGP